MQYSSKILKQTAEALESLEIKFTYKFFCKCLVLEDQPIAIIDSENPLGSCMDEEVLVAFSNGKIAPLPSSSSSSLSSEESDKTVYFVHCKDCNRYFVQTAKSIHEFTCPHCKKHTETSIKSTDKIPNWHLKSKPKKDSIYKESSSTKESSVNISNKEESLLDESLIKSHLDLSPSDSRDMMEKVFDRLKGTPKYIVADEKKIEKIKELEMIYPNMKDVIDYIVSNCNASALKIHKDISFRPIVLVGDSGCGKSSFCSDLCDILMGKPPIKIDLGNNVANFALSGSAPEFRQARHGLIIEAMFSEGDNHPLKNPIIQFDELDKIKKDDSFSIESIFYSILEKANSKRFFDNFLGMNIDASGINYIFTANSLENISSPILNRLKIFEIENYTHEQLKSCVLTNLYINWLENEKMEKEYLPAVLSDEIKEKILRYSNDDPRSIEESIIRVLNETLTYEKTTGHPIALFSQEELEIGWKKFRGKKRNAPEKKIEDIFDPIKLLEQFSMF